MCSRLPSAGGFLHKRSESRRLRERPIAPILVSQGVGRSGGQQMSDDVGTRIFAFELGAIGALLLWAALLRRYGGRFAHPR